MTSDSHFRQLAHLITVGDICSSFVATFSPTQSVEEVFIEWSVDLCAARGMDPMDQIALVEGEHVILGWVGYDMLASDKTISDCMYQIAPDTIIAADTPLLEAVAAFYGTRHPFFFVLKGNRLVGWLSYRDLHKPPLRLCLFALLLNIERMLLEAISLFAKESVGLLSEGRLNKALEIYGLRQYRMDSAGAPFPSLLLECTTIADKITIARKLASTKGAVPSLAQRTFRMTIEKLRNEIAHPGAEERSSSLLTRESFWPFIEWLELLQSELERFLGRAKMGAAS